MFRTWYIRWKQGWAQLFPRQAQLATLPLQLHARRTSSGQRRTAQPVHMDDLLRALGADL